MRKNVIALLLLSALTVQPALAATPSQPSVAVRAEADSQRAPHGRGNVYAPDIVRSETGFSMWFGGQGRDGHDRIHLAVSTDGGQWAQRGVVLEDPSANHCNDPSVVEANGTLFMFYTRAGEGVTDEIAVATSTDAERWQVRGPVLAPGKPGAWDSLAVGRPSVLFENGVFRMWYDGREDLPPDVPDPKAPKSNTSQRHVGYATSRDGIHWERHGSAPIYDHDAGGVHVLRIGTHFAMLVEGRLGTDAATSRDGIHWRRIGLLVECLDLPAERHGHVTPFLLPDRDGVGATFFYGGAAEPAWDANTIYSRRLSDEQWLKLKSEESTL